MKTNIETEFLFAINFAKATGYDFPFSACVQWGCATVEYYGANRELYEPKPRGSLAFVVPVVEGGELIDLCAIDGVTEHCGTRLGLGHGLGLDEVERARWEMCDLRLVSSPLKWLLSPVSSVYLFKLSTVVAELDGVPEITCDSIELAERVAALLPPSERGRVLV